MQPLVAQILMKLDRVGHQLKAFRAPGCPEVDQHDLTSVLLEDFGKLLFVDEVKRRRGGSFFQ
jgi:hypothetical protein